MKIDDRRLAIRLVSAAVLLGFLVYGRLLLVPLVFALLLWAVLNALTDVLRRWHFPVWSAWPVAFTLIGGALYFVALVLINDAAALAARVPVYLTTLTQIWAARMPLARLAPTHGFHALLNQSDLPGILERAAASVGGILLELGLVAIYVGFLLAEQRYLPTKLAKLQSSPAAQEESERVIHAIGQQIRWYLGVCTLVSVLMGAVCYVVLSAFGVHFAAFWTLVMFIVTYIPTVGGVAAALPALMALVQFQSFGVAVIILAILGAAHFVLTDVFEPIALGHSLNLSPFAIILSLTFWYLIWGVSGLFLAVPVTGAIGIACRHLEGFRWVADMIAGPPPRSRKPRPRDKTSRLST